MTKSSINLSRADIGEILHHAHWIAAKNEARLHFMQAKYPTLQFSSLMSLLIEAKCDVRIASLECDGRNYGAPDGIEFN